LEVELLKYRTSEMAAASLILAVRGLKQQDAIWNKEIERVTGMSEQSLKPIVTEIAAFV
jgi:hypothetical protein